MLTPKENYLIAMNHGKPDWIPNTFTDCAILGFGAFNGPWIEKGPKGGGYDGFGVRWETPSSGGGAAIPAPNEFVLDDVTEWKDKVKIPDVDAFDWKSEAESDLELIDRNEKAIEFGCGNGIFERLAALMGFENALVSLITEPEACNDLFTAITDYKIKFAERVAQYYKPDFFNNYDDIATERGLFMSPKTYRDLIKPHHKRLYAAVSDMGMIPIQHTCGKAEELVEDFIEIGVQAWSSVQPTNDIEGIINKYGSKLTIIGGYDTNGRPGSADATVEEMQQEVRRALDTYGKNGSYIFFGFVIANSVDPVVIGQKMMPMIMEAATYAQQKIGE